jgi:polysaccharide biosynthesis/export protein
MNVWKLAVCVASLSVALCAQNATDVAVKQTARPPVGADGIDPNTYIIGSTDVIAVSVWREQELSGSLPVRPDGMVSMPLLHDVKAAGLTPMQLAADLTERLKKFIQDPQVSVVVTSINSKRIFILGQVGHPGPLPLAPGMTALQAIATAGGLGPFANGKKIYILRDQSGTQEKIAFNYKQAVKGDMRQNIALRSGDTIVVP